MLRHNLTREVKKAIKESVWINSLSCTVSFVKITMVALLFYLDFMCSGALFIWMILMFINDICNFLCCIILVYTALRPPRNINFS